MKIKELIKEDILNERIVNADEKKNVDRIFNTLKKIVDADIRFNSNIKFNNTEMYEFYNSKFKYTDTFGNHLTIEYFVYISENTNNKRELLNKVNLNCEADYDEKTITIRLLYEKDKKYIDYNEIYLDLSHEYHHIYQYTKGFTKDVNLYQKVVDGINEDDELYMYASYALYYTFKHEEDAFMVQLYNKLLQNEKKYKNIELTVDMLANMCPQYQNFKKACDNFYDYYFEDVETIKDLENFFGIPASTITNKIRSADVRFKKKFNNIIKKFKTDMKIKYGHRFTENMMEYVMRHLNEGYKCYNDILFIDNLKIVKKRTKRLF